MNYRIEHDSMGDISVPAEALWGGQTERSLENFRIGNDVMPTEVIHALGLIKLSAARVNFRLVPEKMTSEKLDAITSAAEDVWKGKLDSHFPLSVWQTGSGTQTNMNVNEVVANRGNQIAGKRLLHPNDDVNMSQSSNDTFPAAMHIAAVLGIKTRLIPALDGVIETLCRLEAENEGVVKCGRTHLEDAVPMSFSGEISGWRASLERDREMILSSAGPLSEIALGATAVGTGLNCPPGFDSAVAAEISALCGETFRPAKNKYHALSSKDEIAFSHGALKALAADLWKIANDVRMLASGPRCGLSEITIPENEPGSSIMPGKVNPTQCESVTMVALQVMAGDTAVSVAASQGNFELNVFMPVIIYNYLHSLDLLSDSMVSFDKNCLSGIRANRDRMKYYLDSSLMSATLLSPIIGYENTAEIVKKAHSEGKTLRAAAVESGIMTEEEFDKYYHPEETV